MKKDSKSFVTQLLINTLVLLIVDKLFKGIYIDGLLNAVLLAFLLSILNKSVKPVLHLLSLPFTILTLGLFTFVINGAVLWIASWIMGDAFIISSFNTSILAAFVITICRLIVSNKTFMISIN